MDWVWRDDYVRSMYRKWGSDWCANSVITKDVPPYAIAAGNPQKLMKYRFSSNTIEKLQSLEWWNLEFSSIQSIFQLLQSNDIETCINAIEEIKMKG